jgi:hypothetical protein
LYYFPIIKEGRSIDKKGEFLHILTIEQGRSSGSAGAGKDSFLSGFWLFGAMW